jgi:hypothetical protein
MRMHFLLRRAPFIAAAVFATTSAAACTHLREYDDPAYNDRHRWDSREETAYRRWEAERRTEHRSYDRRPADEQRAYWTWRHAHLD